MPESPEVEVLTRFVREHAVGRRIDALEVDEFRAYKTRARGLDELAGREVSGVRRRGKHLVIDTDGPSLVVGFGRAGWLRAMDAGAADAGVVDAAAAGDSHVDAAPIARLRLAAEAGDDIGGFEFVDAGSWLSFTLSIVDDADEVAAVAKLGPDPLAQEYTGADLDAIAVGRRKRLKALLQEQESIAGIGNAYSDEILHVARLSPLAHAASLDGDERATLRTAIHDVLHGALAARTGVPIGELKAHKVAAMRVHGRTGEACPVCGAEVADIPGTKGGGQYCPVCQPER